MIMPVLAFACGRFSDPASARLATAGIIHAKANRAPPSTSRLCAGSRQQRLVFVGELLAAGRWQMAAGELATVGRFP